MNHKISLGLLFGGKSAEHEVSLLSTRNIFKALDQNKYDVLLIGIDPEGRWHIHKDIKSLLATSDMSLSQGTEESIILAPGKGAAEIVSSSGKETIVLDVVFPILHGPYGEDGSVQGFLKLANLPFVGSSILASAIGMDKDVTKRLLRDAGISVADFLVFDCSQLSNIKFENVSDKLGIPFFVKPANLGSSVGINKVSDIAQFRKAIEEAFEYDTKVLIEEFIEGREIECAVLGDYEPIASIPGEIIAQDEFYSYEAKYIDENGSILEIPAPIPPDTAEAIKQIAVRVFKTLNCHGMARVDFFLKETGELVVNEINTIPGFTDMSMYPKLWEASGIPFPSLIDKLVEMAIARHERESKLRYSVSRDI